ncbi:DUF5458 family protein [Chitinophaga pinensis]|uniref:Type VI secretion system contractile sheath protein TssC n=1 Tax=Chitinophaga pinensis (strain ATCC 43595 / DSM 2588 / LMG 13176 / NBRC 15968 / NCIMB 11800 / UQM 2034) TaxID=485918 RepID=A0A979G7Q3_CHIPD|nr:DUF5458 family protein [Chitinophaga pinensis]ACU62306.1 hypothetical protein Cpin_4872 [Chitinophaga pinensis DSM 2588]
MASTEKQQAAGVQTAERAVKAELSLAESLEKLARVGGIDLLETAIDGLQNLNPDRKARKQIFLTGNEKRREREELKKKIRLWIDILENADSVATMIERSNERLQVAEENINKNIGIALKATRELEQSYRAVNLFYQNTEADKLKNVVLLNASQEQIQDLDNPRFIEYVNDELKQKYDRLDLRENYSLLVVPGYMGSNKVVEKWAAIAYKHKAMLITDFADLDHPDDVIDLFTEANLTGGDAYRSNVIMTCNWLIGRGKVQEVGENDDLTVPGSAALAGKMYHTLMSQVTAGKKHGSMNDVDGVRFELKKSEISHLERLGLVPMVNEYGKVMAFSAKTLFNGDNIGLQTYSVVRVFDYITKVLFDFLNRRAFENWTSKTEKDLRGQIVKFLDRIQGPDRLIEHFKIMRFERDEVQKDTIHLDIHITPYFPAKSFVVKLDGYKGEDEATTWASEYAQQ